MIPKGYKKVITYEKKIFHDDNLHKFSLFIVLIPNHFPYHANTNGYMPCLRFNREEEILGLPMLKEKDAIEVLLRYKRLYKKHGYYSYEVFKDDE